MDCKCVWQGDTVPAYRPKNRNWTEIFEEYINSEDAILDHILVLENENEPSWKKLFDKKNDPVNQNFRLLIYFM